MTTYDLVPLDDTGTLDLTALNAAAAEGWRVVAVVKRPDAFAQMALVQNVLQRARTEDDVRKVFTGPIKTKETA